MSHHPTRPHFPNATPPTQVRYRPTPSQENSPVVPDDLPETELISPPLPGFSEGLLLEREGEDEEEGMVSTPLTVPNPVGQLVWGVLERTEGKGGEERFELKLPEGEYTIGRSSQCSYSLKKYPFLSSTHCTISLVNTYLTDLNDIQVTITDNKTLNGTFVNKRRLGTTPKVLQDGDLICLSQKNFISKPASEELCFTFRFPHLDPLNEKYEIREVIGRGHFSVVKSAVCLETCLTVAIKIIDKNHLIDSNMRDYCQREVEIMKKVSHPFINGIQTLVESVKQLSIITELAKHGDLFNYLTTHNLNLQDFRCVFYQILSAVKYLHSNNIVHRDLKPENILIFDQGRMLIKVADFGLSRFFTHQENLLSMVGSPSYVAPEVTSGQGYTSSCDMWSIGVMMYFAVAKQMPFTHTRPVTLEDTGCLSDRDFNHHPDVFRILTRLLVYQSQGRYSASRTLRAPFFMNYPDAIRYLTEMEVNFSPPPGSLTPSTTHLPTRSANHH